MLISPISLMIAGPFADKVGFRPWFLIAGISCVVMGILGFFSHDILAMENSNTTDHETVAVPQA
jgi:MFS family permease